MIRELVEDVDGKTHERLVPETAEERRKLLREQHAAQGGIDKRDATTPDPAEAFVDD